MIDILKGMATKNNFVQPRIPKFDGHYHHWSMLMENFLHSKDCQGLVKNGIPTTVDYDELTEAQNNTIEDTKLKDLKIKNYMFQNIDQSTMETIKLASNSKKKFLLSFINDFSHKTQVYFLHEKS